MEESGAVLFKDQGEIDACVAKWQERLRLQDWDVSARFAEQREFSKMGRDGQCRRWEEERKALIYLAYPGDHTRQEQEWGLLDQEFLLVHEMLHIVFQPLETAIGAGWNTSDVNPTYMASEQIVNQLARALVGLDRAATRLKPHSGRIQGITDADVRTGRVVPNGIVLGEPAGARPEDLVG